MNKFYKFIEIIIVSILILVMSSFSQTSGKKNNPVLLTRQGYNCQAMQEFFLDALISANEAGGLMLIKNSCLENIAFPKYKPDELSFKEKLKLITQLNPNYSWKNEDGVVNLAPTQSVPELLRVKIRSIKLTFDNNLNLVLDTLLKLPEVKEKLKELNLREGIQFGGLQSPPDNRPPTEMLFKDKTLQEILNEIVKKRGRGVWVYNESHYNGEYTFMLDFLVR